MHTQLLSFTLVPIRELPQNMARPPASLPPTGSNPLKVSLYLGSFVHDPSEHELFDLVVPPSQTPVHHPDEVAFHARPEIVHTFRPEQKLPPKFISAVFTLALAAPWVVLLGLVRTTPHSSSHTHTVRLRSSTIYVSPGAL